MVTDENLIRVVKAYAYEHGDDEAFETRICDVITALLFSARKMGLPPGQIAQRSLMASMMVDR